MLQSAAAGSTASLYQTLQASKYILQHGTVNPECFPLPTQMQHLAHPKKPLPDPSLIGAAQPTIPIVYGRCSFSHFNSLSLSLHFITCASPPFLRLNALHCVSLFRSLITALSLRTAIALPARHGLFGTLLPLPAAFHSSTHPVRVSPVPHCTKPPFLPSCFPFSK